MTKPVLWLSKSGQTCFEGPGHVVAVATILAGSQVHAAVNIVAGGKCVLPEGLH